MNKQTFAAFIAQKRRECGMTQEELAGKLFVSHTTVSKWERGLSYPDIALVPSVCRELSISEHEFFTACDDMQARVQKKEAKRWRNMVRTWEMFFFIGYALALVTCFICNLAIDHRLDWFWIVVSSLALAFSFTSLPSLLKRERTLTCLASGTGCLLLLLLACGLYTGGDWLVSGLSIVAVSLALPWGVYLLWRFYGKHMVELSLGVTTVWTYLLLTVICLVTGGDWLFSMGVPIATLSYTFIWAFFSIARWAPINGCLKSAAYLALTAAAIPLGTGLGGALSGDYSGVIPFAAYFDWTGNLLYDPTGNMGNRLTFVALLFAAVVLLIVGIFIAVSRRRRANRAGKECMETQQ